MKKFHNPVGRIGTTGPFQSGDDTFQTANVFFIRSFNASRRLLLASSDTDSMISDACSSHSDGKIL